MILIYLETPIGVPGECGLDPLQDILPSLTVASPDFPVVHLPSERGEIWISFDEGKTIWSGSSGWYFRIST